MAISTFFSIFGMFSFFHSLIQLKKCYFALSKVEYMGCSLTTDMLELQPLKNVAANSLYFLLWQNVADVNNLIKDNV